MTKSPNNLEDGELLFKNKRFNDSRGWSNRKLIKYILSSRMGEIEDYDPDEDTLGMREYLKAQRFLLDQKE